MSSRSFTVGPQTLSVDPYTGKLQNNAKPFSKADANRIAPDHTVTVQHADGTTSLVVIKGATYTELRDKELMLAIVTGDWDDYLSSKRVTNERWHSYIIELAKQHPHLVKTADTVKPLDDDGELVT